MTANPSFNSSSTPAKVTTYPLPTLGSIVWTHFPLMEFSEPGSPHVHPRPKPRPALVVGVDQQGGNVIVIYGTSQKVAPHELYPTEFVVEDTDMDFSYTGLSHTTKFDMGREVKLPYNSEYFKVPNPRHGKPTPTDPRLGILPMSYVPALKKAAEKVKK